ncbi:MAG: glycoside hydrolase family 25 [Oscillospiraceae bacterium]|nr:glycoside hydrolase family 25 [Oscillospiraceae bacterium]
MKKIFTLLSAAAMTACMTQEIPAPNNALSAIAVTNTVSAEGFDMTRERLSINAPDRVDFEGLAAVGASRDIPVFEVYSVVRPRDLIPDGATPVSDFAYTITRTGNFSIKLRYDIDGTVYTDRFRFRGADTTPPVLLNAGDIRHRKGEAFDLSDYVGVGDYYDDHVTISYTGDVDTDTEGSYRIRCYASDTSGNTREWNSTVTVYEPSQGGGYTPSGSFISFDDFADAYGSMGELGIDISKWQGDEVDFARLRDAGCKFVMMRIGADTNGIYEDICFDRNIREAKAAGLKVGVYFYTDSDSEQRVNEMCDWIIDKLDGESLDLPVSFDWEEFGHYQRYGMSLHRLNELYGIFEERMNDAGYEACLYGSKNYLTNVWDTEAKTWLAHYTKLGATSNYEGDYFMWQMCSDGRIDGIDGDVDFDVLIHG